MANDRRQTNDYRLRIFGGDDQRPIAFVCECDDAGCTRTVVLTGLAYAGLRRHGEAVLFPSHIPDADAPLGGEAAMIDSADNAEARPPAGGALDLGPPA